jgi:hypothetical protein
MSYSLQLLINHEILPPDGTDQSRDICSSITPIMLSLPLTNTTNHELFLYLAHTNDELSLFVAHDNHEHEIHFYLVNTNHELSFYLALPNYETDSDQLRQSLIIPPVAINTNHELHHPTCIE